MLDRPPFNKAQILVAGRNFGCGSSREQAVWALTDFGIRCVIAPRFGEIFFANCFRNGVLALRLADDLHGLVMSAALTESLSSGEPPRKSTVASHSSHNSQATPLMASSTWRVSSAFSKVLNATLGLVPWVDAEASGGACCLPSRKVH